MICAEVRAVISFTNITSHWHHSWHSALNVLTGNEEGGAADRNSLSISNKRMAFRWPSLIIQSIGSIALLVVVQWAVDSVDAYSIPKPKATLVSPRGFRVSIPDERGVTFFAFHGNVNREFRGTENGEFHGEARQAQNGEWVFKNDRYQFQPGDILYYWIYVQHNRLGYRIDNAQLVYPDDFQAASSSGGGGNGGRPGNRPFQPVYIGVENDDAGQDSGINVIGNIGNGIRDNGNNWNNGNSGNGNHGQGNGNQWLTPQRPTSRATPAPSSFPIAGRPTARSTTPRTTTKATTTAAPCTPSITTARSEPVRCSGRLIFEEQFLDGLSEKWKPDIRMPLDTEDAEFVLYHQYHDVWNVSNGNLYIFPKLLTSLTDFGEERLRNGEIDLGTDCTVLLDYNQECRRKAEFARILPPIITSKFTTRKSFSFKYGKVEIRAKLPNGDWLYPQLFLEPVDNSYYGISGFANGQMRVASIRSNSLLDTKGSIQIDGHRLSGGLVLTSGEGLRENLLKSSLHENHISNDFHTFTLTWTDQRITLGVDGSNYATINGNFKDLSSLLKIPHQVNWKRGNAMAPFDREFYISLGVAAGGIADFPDGAKTGEGHIVKPWENTSPKAELRFWSSKDDWYPTWKNQSAGLIVDYIKVWSV